jgi:molybdopterin/thiamine biosynthesis adenylyltransferase
MSTESNRYSRHEAFIPSVEQEKLHRARILIAGCGAGSPVVPYLARLGIGTKGDIVCADPDIVEINNLNRQAYGESNVDQNKAQALVNVVHGINSEVNAKAVTEGITEENIEHLIGNSDVVVEMVDVAAPHITFAIHEAAEKFKKPLVTGMDVGEGILVSVFDYRSSLQMSYRQLLGLAGNLSKKDLTELPALGLVIQNLLGPVNQQFPTIQAAKS